jgi:peptidoglycan/xylan/chitin deacetylase (PgdA/CDA1 family)
MKRILSLAALLVLWWTSVAGAAAGRPVPVMLSFDTERNGDVEALGRLGVTVPATYFITGSFAQANRGFVAGLAREGNTIGSHSHTLPRLRELDTVKLEAEMRKAKQTLESITGRPVVWFRAPFMDYTMQAMAVLKKLGFRYDSSDQGRWQRQDILSELPVSSFMNGTMIASDYDMLYKQKSGAAEFERWLKALYDEKSSLGQPVMILLHPTMAARYPEALQSFIAYVRQQGGSFVTADTYIASVHAHRPRRFAVWVDFSLDSHDPATIAANLAGIGATDVFLMARDSAGKCYFNPGGKEDLFGKTLNQLRQKGMRVHAWIPALANASLLRSHPEWGMVAQNGTRSDSWLSPSQPGVLNHAVRTVKDLLGNYDLDGIHLDNLCYPDLNHDFSPSEVKAFALKNTAGVIPANQELITARYSAWTNWRAARIAQFTGSIREAVRSAGGSRVELSASLSGGSAVSFRDAEKRGQDYALIAEQLDLLVPAVSYEDDSAVDARVSHLALSIRNRVGEKPVLIGLSAETCGSVSPDAFSMLVARTAPGADGMGVGSYSCLFGSGGSGANRRAENLEILNKVFAGGIPEAIPAPEKSEVSYSGIAFPELPLVPSLFTVVALVIINLVAIPVFGKKQHAAEQSSGTHAESTMKDRGEIEEEIADGVLDGRTAEQLAAFLHRFDARQVQQNRIALVLDMIGSSDDPLPEIYRLMDDSHEWKALALKYFHEACLLGYASIEDRSVALTLSGRMTLLKAREAGYDRSLWVFVERRLHETVVADCPHCGRENLTHFFWDTYECTGCGKRVRMSESGQLAVRKRAGSAAYTNSIEFY